MPKLTMLCGMILTLLGVICYVFAQPLGAAQASVTALIPTFLGVPLMLLDWLSLLKPTARMHFMHVAVLLATLGGLASLGRLISVMIKHPNLGVGVVANLIMAIVCGVYVAMSVRSFINARRSRQQQSGGEASAAPPGGAA